MVTHPLAQGKAGERLPSFRGARSANPESLAAQGPDGSRRAPDSASALPDALITMRHGCNAGKQTPSARKPEHQQECAVQLFGRFRVDAANDPSNTVAAQRDQLIRHDLRPKAETVLGSNFD